ncbi:RNA polymerase Rpb3/Rpb11 dimerisation domain protein [uncultured archaeon]|nr:RNA polymerase Rpb3/Rpb11 dimerisation domain protein [uncultured archaeon]
MNKVKFEELKSKESYKLKFEGEDQGLLQPIVEKIVESGTGFASSVLDHPLQGNVILTVKDSKAKEKVKKACKEVIEEIQSIEKSM